MRLGAFAVADTGRALPCRSNCVGVRAGSSSSIKGVASALAPVAFPPSGISF